MNTKSLVSPIALAFGLALTGAAAAQTSVGGQDISDADLPFVQQHCDALSTGATTDPQSDTTASIDVATITLDDCMAAGLVDGETTLPAEPMAAPEDDAPDSGGGASDSSGQ